MRPVLSIMPGGEWELRPIEMPLLPEPKDDESAATALSKSPIDSVEFEVKLSSHTTASSTALICRWWFEWVDDLQNEQTAEPLLCVYCNQLLYHSLEMRYQNWPTR